jgi:hypothetical protein
VQAQVGDELSVKGRHLGDKDGHCEIIEVIGADGTPPYLVRWPDGYESLLFIRSIPSSTTRQDRARDTRGRVLLIHREMGGEAPRFGATRK